jgi:uncharacterized metal-binding protein YceD (DUF177 family)
MIEEFKVYTDRLKDGHVQKIEGAFDPALLEIDERDLQFHHPISTQAEAYSTDEDLVVRVSASTAATMPCAICNEPVSTPLSCVDFYIAEPLSEMKDGVYDFALALREGLLTQLPHTVECNGSCPGRKTMKQYFRSEEEEKKSPFKDINLDK